MPFTFKLDRSKLPKKIDLKYIVVLRLNTTGKTKSKIALVTTDGKFAEYDMCIHSDAITWSVAARIRSLFDMYQISYNTEVIFNDEYSVKDPLYMYFQFLRQQMLFNMRKVKIVSMLRAIKKQHSMFCKVARTDVSIYFANRIWEKLVEKEICPWISKEFDAYIKNLSSDIMRERKMIRMAAYYLVVKDLAHKNKLK